MRFSGVVRSLAEVRFAASLAPCSKCGAATPARIDLYGNSGVYVMIGKCPGCGAAREFHFRSERDPLDLPNAPFELGLSEPSQILAPHEFLEELRRIEARFTKPLAALSGDERHARSDDAHRAVTAILELCKFLPTDAARIPETDPAAEEYTRAWLEQERERILDRLEAFRADAPRVWRLNGTKLRLGDEIRALLDQVGRKGRDDTAALRRYVDARGPAKPDDDVGAIDVRETSGRAIAELTVRRGAIDDLESAFGRVDREGDRGTFKLRAVATGRTMIGTVELDGQRVNRLAIEF